MWYKKKNRERTGEISEIILIENFPELVSDMKTQIQENQKAPSQDISSKTTHMYIIFKLHKIKEKKKKCWRTQGVEPLTKIQK